MTKYSNNFLDFHGDYVDIMIKSYTVQKGVNRLNKDHGEKIIQVESLKIISNANTRGKYAMISVTF